MWKALSKDLLAGDVKAIARAISLVENEAAGFEGLMRSLPHNNHAQVIGITGPPGAGKSTLTDKLVGAFIKEGKKVAVLCVDPSSPFNLGAVLGDRIRMNEWYDHPHVFIRSLATRGSLGGLHPKIMEVTDLMKAAGFDIIIIETVGVGQSEVEVAGLADITIVMLVPESGDEVQTMKAGLMEIADIFVVNKADRPGADHFVKNLRLMLAPAFRQQSYEVPVLKTTASRNEGIEELVKAIQQFPAKKNLERRRWLLAQKAYFLLRDMRMKDIRKEELLKQIPADVEGFNVYRFITDF